MRLWHFKNLRAYLSLLLCIFLLYQQPLAQTEQKGDSGLTEKVDKAEMHQALLVQCAVKMRQGQLAAAREDLIAAQTAGAPESNWQPLAEELARKEAGQRQETAPTTAP